MAMNQPHQVYKTNSVTTATPQELTLLLYNGCLKFIKLAERAIEEKNIESRHENLLKAQNIIHEFMVTLNMDIPVSKNLLQMYDYILRRLVDANTKNDLAALKEAESFVLELRDTWKEAMKLTKMQKVGSGSV